MKSDLPTERLKKPLAKARSKINQGRKAPSVACEARNGVGRSLSGAGATDPLMFCSAFGLSLLLGNINTTTSSGLSVHVLFSNFVHGTSSCL